MKFEKEKITNEEKVLDFLLCYREIFTYKVGGKMFRGRYIGIKDKNGVEIKEGCTGRYRQTDGAKRNGKPIICVGKVIYNAKTASFAVESTDDYGCKYFDYFPIRGFEVIK